jgi:hypothetical protein
MKTPIDMEKLKYPIGKFVWNGALTADERKVCIQRISAAPKLVRAAVKGLNETQLNTPYRPEGWTVRQVVHHLPDSHMQGYARIKLALTEDVPTVKPYQEQRWAVTPDPARLSVDVSLTILDGLHARWVELLSALTPEQFTRKFFHPENKSEWPIDWIVALYAWHGEHHAAHITSLREREGW